MENFIMIDDLGIRRECSVVATTIYNNERYAIYTDYVGNGQGGLRLLVAKIVEEESLIPTDKSLEKEILNDFRNECNYFKKVQEI